jgi:hypothetical protein
MWMGNKPMWRPGANPCDDAGPTGLGLPRPQKALDNMCYGGGLTEDGLRRLLAAQKPSPRITHADSSFQQSFLFEVAGECQYLCAEPC